MFVAAVFAPERPEKAQLQITWITSEPVGYRLVFGSGKGYFVEFRLGNRHGGRKISHDSGGCPAWVCNRNSPGNFGMSRTLENHEGFSLAPTVGRAQPPATICCHDAFRNVGE